jgi:hypothetical protein
MVTKIGTVLEKPVDKITCKHHWVIEPPDGPTSRGKCKLCGETKIFDNMLEDSVPAKNLEVALGIDFIVAKEDMTDTEDNRTLCIE